jgi:3-oxoacyl-[acyl-carrier protein] reductase
VLITGAAGGIGRATAMRAAAEGASVAAVGHDDAGLALLVDEIRARGGDATMRSADVSDPVAITAAVDECADELGGLDVAYANAGILPPAASLGDLDLDVWNRVLAVNLTGVTLTFRAALPHFDDDGGVLLATGSSLAIRPGAGNLAYAVAKAGVHTLVRSLAIELAPRNIRANVIAPGVTETPMTVGLPGHIDRALPGVPLGTLVQPEEVAALAVHLMSAEARSITGTVVSIDGGRAAV